jgi:NAD(P)H-nitrite reductase large subunit
MLAGGVALSFDKLLLATGAEPTRLKTSGTDLPHVRALRSLADSRELISRAQKGSRAVVVGASFIGLETAAALRHRDVEVHASRPRRGRWNGRSARCSVISCVRCMKRVV